MIGPRKSLPHSDYFKSVEEYVDALEFFVTSTPIFQVLCGGVHILDFFTHNPELYHVILPEEWRSWFDQHEVGDILDFLLRENLTSVCVSGWRGGTCPPDNLVQYVQMIRRLHLDTTFLPKEDTESIGAHIQPKIKGDKYKPSRHAMMAGMSEKKIHEVSNFAHFIADLSNHIMDYEPQNQSQLDGYESSISHIVDFGSGQNYLGRVLASNPYGKHIVAVESRPHIVEGAKKMDVRVNLTDRKMIMRNKKEFKRQGGWKSARGSNTLADGIVQDEIVPIDALPESVSNNDDQKASEASISVTDSNLDNTPGLNNKGQVDEKVGSVQYIQHCISDGNLSHVIDQVDPSTLAQSKSPSVMVVSLHSCGNLVHHGLRTMQLNPAVRVVAMVGCCYNLMSERLGPATYKLPAHRRANVQRLIDTSMEHDPHGFPMSDRFCTHKHKPTKFRNYSDETTESDDCSTEDFETGIRLNITARMMAVQAPRNWTSETSDAFFQRHFFRALLQKIFMDRGVFNSTNADTPLIADSDSLHHTTPIIIGGLTKSCYVDFVAYVRGAIAKLSRMAADSSSEPEADTVSRQNTRRIAEIVQKKAGPMSDTDIREYAQNYASKRKSLCIVWSLMAFSAQVLEALIVTDRWLWLKQQEYVEEAWVQTVFDYKKSPRNMVVVGIKKHNP